MRLLSDGEMDGRLGSNLFGMAEGGAARIMRASERRKSIVQVLAGAGFI